MLRRLPTGKLLLAAGAVLVVALAFAWLAPAPDYLYLPNQAAPVADKVEVPGEKPGDGKGGIYYVDVTVRQAR